MTPGFRERLRLTGLHCVARAALRCTSPIKAKHIVDVLGRRLMPRKGGLPDAENALQFLAARGTCLSRSLTVAACFSDADVVIGVDPRRSMQLSGHAWVEVNGVPLGGQDAVGSYEELARLRGRERFEDLAQQ
jgi:hypothetical protein